MHGYVGLSSSLSLAYPPNGRAVSGKYDAIGVLEHEISEDMGRVANYGLDDYSALSLFRYTSDGVLANTGNESAYFSIDGGNTNLAEFNNGSNGDPGDWASSVLDDSYDAFSNAGVANTVSATDLKVMEALGFTLAPACYAAGTRILTAQGEVRVEGLAVGDMVWARFAGLTAIKWIGHRSIDCRRHPDPQQVWPVRIVAGAFAFQSAVPRSVAVARPRGGGRRRVDPDTAAGEQGQHPPGGRGAGGASISISNWTGTTCCSG